MTDRHALIERANYFKETPKSWRVKIGFNNRGSVALTVKLCVHRLSCGGLPLLWR
jgi:hypothetical protein